MVEYALLLSVMIGGGAAMIKQTGLEVRDTFEATSAILGGGANGGGRGGTGSGSGSESSDDSLEIRIPEAQRRAGVER
jgi:hypothetical protein